MYNTGNNFVYSGLILTAETQRADLHTIEPGTMLRIKSVGD